MTILNYFIRVFDFIIYGNFFIALCATAQTLQTVKLRHYSIDGNPHLIFVFAATFFLYNIHKILTFRFRKEDFDNITPATQRTETRFLRAKSFETPLSILTFTAGMVSLECYLRFYIDTQWLVVGAGAVCLFYIMPLLNGKRLRDIPYIKVFMIAGVWTFVTVVFPLKAFAKEWYSCDTFLIVEKLAFILALTLPFDIRDMSWDAQTKVKTIPLSIGIVNSKWLSLALLILSFIMSILIFMMGVYTIKTLIAIGISVTISAWVVYQAHESKSDYFYYFLLDGMMLLQSILTLASRFDI